MNELMLSNKMTSLQLAEITGKNHAHLLRDIRTMEDAWEKVTESKFGLSEYKDSTGRFLPMYELSKTETLYIATKFNDEARAKVILRWEELENNNQQKKLSTKELLVIALQEISIENQNLLLKTEIQEQELKIQAPKVKYCEEVLSSTSTYPITLIAKELGMTAIALNRVLHDKKVQYKQSGTWVLYEKYQNKEYTKTTTHSFTDSQGKTKTTTLMVWTETGRKKIHEFIKQLNQ